MAVHRSDIVLRRSRATDGRTRRKGSITVVVGAIYDRNEAREVEMGMFRGAFEVQVLDRGKLDEAADMKLKEHERRLGVKLGRIPALDGRKLLPVEVPRPRDEVLGEIKEGKPFSEIKTTITRIAEVQKYFIYEIPSAEANGFSRAKLA